MAKISVQETANKIAEFQSLVVPRTETAARVSYSRIGKSIVPTNELLKLKNIIKNFGNYLKLNFDINVVAFNFRCEEIIVKNNIRINFLTDRRSSAKIHNNDFSKNFLTDVRSREIVDGNVKNLKIFPEAYEIDKDFRWIVEEYAYSGFLKAGKINPDFFQKIFSVYKSTSKAERIPDLDEEFVRGVFDKRTSDAILDLAHADKSFVYAFCHGDLNHSNLMYDDAGNTLICDWEHAREGPVVFDLAKIYVNHKHARPAILEIVEDLCKLHSDVMPARQQLAIGVVNHLSKSLNKSGKKLKLKHKIRSAVGKRLVRDLLFP